MLEKTKSLHTLHPLDCPDVSVCMIPVEHVLASLMEGPGLHVSLVFALFIHPVYTKVQLMLLKVASVNHYRLPTGGYIDAATGLLFTPTVAMFTV